MIPHNLVDHPRDGLGLEAAEDLLERAQQGRPLLRLRRILWPPHAPSRADAPKVKAQEAEVLPSCQVHDPAFLFIDLNMEEGQLLPEPFGDRCQQPVMAGVGVHQDDDVIGKARVLHIRVLAESGDFLGPLQHPIYLSEVEIAEQRGDDAPNAKGNFAFDRTLRYR
jgi:hypothetical protein